MNHMNQLEDNLLNLKISNNPFIDFFLDSEGFQHLVNFLKEKNFPSKIKDPS